MPACARSKKGQVSVSSCVALGQIAGRVSVWGQKKNVCVRLSGLSVTSKKGCGLRVSLSVRGSKERAWLCVQQPVMLCKCLYLKDCYCQLPQADFCFTPIWSRFGTKFQNGRLSVSKYAAHPSTPPPPAFFITVES